MGIYFFAVDYSSKKEMWAPDNFSDKCIYYPGHPLPLMIVMKNTQGYNFEVVNDFEVDDVDFEDVTDEVYKELKDEFPDFNWDKH